MTSPLYEGPLGYNRVPLPSQGLVMAEWWENLDLYFPLRWLGGHCCVLSPMTSCSLELSPQHSLWYMGLISSPGHIPPYSSTLTRCWVSQRLHSAPYLHTWTPMHLTVCAMPPSPVTLTLYQTEPEAMERGP